MSSTAELPKWKKDNLRRTERMEEDPEYAEKMREQWRTQYERKKARRENDSEYAEKKREQWRKANAKRTPKVLTPEEQEALRAKERERSIKRREEARKKREEDAEFAAADRERKRSYARKWEDKQKAKGPEFLEQKRQMSAAYREGANRVIYKATARKIEVTASREEIESVMANPCHYCGATDNIGVDRVDSGLGYSVANMVASCPDCNYAKHVTCYNDFIRSKGLDASLLRPDGDTRTCPKCKSKKTESNFRFRNLTCKDCTQ